MKKILATVLAIAAALSLAAVAYAAEAGYVKFSIPADHGNYYADALSVVSVDETEEGYLITAQKMTGIEFSFLAYDGDYFPGDLVAVIMNDNNTPEIFDDAIITARYAGYGDPANW